MGSLFVVSLPPENSDLFDGVFKRLRAYDQALSDYLPDSELNQVLKQAGALVAEPHQWVSISPILCQALLDSRYYHAISGGAFDISLEPLLQIWGFKTRQYRRPDAVEIEAALLKIHPSPYGLQARLFDRTNSTCDFQLRHSAARLDFGAIGKGLALDAAMGWLKSQGVAYAALDAGGSTQLFWGSPPYADSQHKRGWPVQLRAALTQTAKDSTISQIYWLHNQAVSSSNQNQQFFKLGDQVYGHILDPRTGYPAAPTQQITVIAATATQADATSTILLLSPPQQDGYYQRLLNLQILRY